MIRLWISLHGQRVNLMITSCLRNVSWLMLMLPGIKIPPWHGVTDTARHTIGISARFHRVRCFTHHSSMITPVCTEITAWGYFKLCYYCQWFNLSWRQTTGVAIFSLWVRKVAWAIHLFLVFSKPWDSLTICSQEERNSGEVTMLLFHSQSELVY